MTGHINLQLGWPSPSLFPSSDLLSGASNIFTSPKKSAEALVYGPDAGYAPLRSSIANWLSSVYSDQPPTSSERICITNGASGNLGNILAKFTEPGYTRRIWMIEPSYFLACPIFMDAGFAGLLRGVPEDAEGLDIEYLRKALTETEHSIHRELPKYKTGPRYEKLYKHVIYLVPTFSNPSGKTMSLQRRHDLVRLAREFDALVVTDDVYDVLRWPEDSKVDLEQLGAVPPRIVDVDRTLDGGVKDKWGHAVSNGSFSKIVTPGMRVGWAESTPAFSFALSQVGSTRSGGCPTQISAAIVDELLESGDLQKHVKEVLIPTFRDRWAAMMEAIKSELLPLGFQISTGKPYSVELKALPLPRSSSYTRLLAAKSSSASLKSKANGLLNGNAETNGANHPVRPTVSEAGGYFVYLSAPKDVEHRVAELAKLGLEKYDLKFAFGDMFQVEGDHRSVERAKEGYGKGIRLSWAWHTKEEITEGIQRLAQLVKDAQAGKV